MSDTRTVYIPEYHKTQTRAGCTPRLQQNVASKLKKIGIVVPLRAICQVWTDPALRGPITTDDIIEGFELFSQVVGVLPVIMVLPRYRSDSAEGAISAFIRALQQVESKASGFFLESLGLNGVSRIVRSATINVALQVSYVVPLKSLSQ